MNCTANRLRIPLARGCAAALLAALASTMAFAGPAHEHGVARLEVAVSRSGISLRLESALDNLVGFERAPRTAAERAAVAEALKKLGQARTVFRVDAAGACDGGQSTVETPLLWQAQAASAPTANSKRPAQPAQPATAASSTPPALTTEHGDLDASYEFKCASASKALRIETSVFEAFPRIQRLQVQMVTPRGQRSVVLRPGQTKLSLDR